MVLCANIILALCSSLNAWKCIRNIYLANKDGLVCFNVNLFDVECNILVQIGYKCMLFYFSYNKNIFLFQVSVDMEYKFFNSEKKICTRFKKINPPFECLSKIEAIQYILCRQYNLWLREHYNGSRFINRNV